jgi:ferredoxin-NADP reductase
MAGTAVLGRLTWQLAGVVDISVETSRTKTLVLEVPEWLGHLPGQHVDVRLTAEDGYQTQRSYSIASAPDGKLIELTIERLEDGEVSIYLADELRPGDRFELRGPIGGYFTWRVEVGGPLLLIGGGSGVVPLMAMLRHRAKSGSDVPTKLLYSSRSFGDIVYREELDRFAQDDANLQIIHTLTRSQPAEWTGQRRRIDEAMLAEVAWSPEELPLCFVCGPTRLVETVATGLTNLGHDPPRIKTERFGPTGG